MHENPLPRFAIVLGVAGLLPFLATLVVAWVAPAGLRALALGGLVAYGAVILSFLGAVHWGFAICAPIEDAGAARARYGLGVVPALIGWVALLLPAWAGLWLLALALPAVAAVESWAALRGLVPPGYLALRWGLSLGGGACLGLGGVVAWASLAT